MREFCAVCAIPSVSTPVRSSDWQWQVSDWQLRPLMQEQLDYAAQDAHICVRLFDSHLGVQAAKASSHGKFHQGFCVGSLWRSEGTMGDHVIDVLIIPMYTLNPALATRLQVNFFFLHR